MEQRNPHSFFKCIALVFLFSIQSAEYCNAIKGVPKGGKGKWELLLNNSGVVAMHMALTHLNTLVILDQISPQSAYRLRRRHNGTRCQGTLADLQDSSCYAHSMEYDIRRNKIRALSIQTDAWCSSVNDGRIIQVGGYGNGGRRVGYFRPCGDGKCDWKHAKSMSNMKWYASTLLLPENDQIIVLGGRNAFTYEFVPRLSSKKKSHLIFPYCTRLMRVRAKDQGAIPVLAH